MSIIQNYENTVFENGMPVRVLIQQLNHFKLHWHQHHELLFVIRGSMFLHIGGKDYELGKGSLAFIQSPMLHSVSGTAESIVIAVQFETDFFNLYPSIKSLAFSFDKFIEDQSDSEQTSFFDHIRNAVKDLAFYYNKRSSGFCYLVSTLAFHIISLLISKNYFTECGFSDTNDQSYKYISDIIDIVNQRYAEDLSLSEIASQFYISYYHLSRKFKEVVGISFREYLHNVRLHKAAKELRDTKDAILSIAVSHGFSAASSFTQAFQKRYGITPLEYRRQFETTYSDSGFNIGREQKMFMVSLDHRESLEYIYSFINRQSESRGSSILQNTTHREIIANVKAEQGSLSHIWSILGACGRASDLLRSDVQQHIILAKNHIGYKYIRFHAIFSDDMMICSRAETGELVFNWTHLNKILDFLLQNGLKPFIELSFMPEALASGNQTIYWYKANVSMPKAWSEWEMLVRNLLIHCVHRYGSKEVAEWYFEVWNEPDYQKIYWDGTFDDYAKLYAVSANAIKSICPKAKVGGPSITHIQYEKTEWIRNFLLFIRTHDLPIDFLSYHIYADSSSDYSAAGYHNFPNISDSTSIQEGRELDLIQHHQQTCNELGFSRLEHIITEWNISAKRNLRIRDTAFMAPYIIGTALKCSNHASMMCYYCTTDFNDEISVPSSSLSGSYGLISIDGIPKSSFWAFYLLNKVGNTILAKSKGYCISKSGEQLQILLYNLAGLDSLAQQNINLVNQASDIYTFFEECQAVTYHVTIQNTSGKWKQTSYTLNREYGSMYDIASSNLSSSTFSAEEIAYLKSVSVPKLSSEYIECQQGKICVSCCVPPHGCCLMILDPVLEEAVPEISTQDI